MPDDPVAIRVPGAGAARTAAAAAADCPDCAAARDHCHGVLVLHGEGPAECVESGVCEPSIERHPLVETCARMQPPCRCGDRLSA